MGSTEPAKRTNSPGDTEISLNRWAVAPSDRPMRLYATFRDLGPTTGINPVTRTPAAISGTDAEPCGCASSSERRYRLAVDPDRAREQADPIADAYATRARQLQDLEQEALFIVNRLLSNAHIKTHSVTHRVKTLDSLRQKLHRKGQSNTDLNAIVDLLGLRVVALFLSDIPAILELLRETFTVVSEDDKVAGAGDEETFGYMSYHLAVMLKDTYSGPRYDDLKNITFEIQVRTILMDAWATVSHYLDYKGEQSIPTTLRRDFFALSGLFYVADKHFEMFFAESLSSRALAQSLVGSDATDELDLNLDTFEALLERRYRGREASSREALSRLVEHLTAKGYRTVADVIRLLDETNEAFMRYEDSHPPADAEDGLFNWEGVVRCSLKLSLSA